MKRFFIYLFLLIFVVSFQVMAADWEASIIDDLGSEVVLHEKPQRIISLAPNNTEILFSLGLDDEIIGVTSFANYPEEALEKEKIGTITDPNIEKIVSLKPDLIVASGINKMSVIKQLKKLGFKVVGFYPRKIDDIYSTIKRLGKITGKEEKAREIVTEMYIRIAAIKNLVEENLKGKEKLKVFYEIWSDPLYTAGANTFIDDVITMLGGINIGRQAKGPWPQYSLEKLLLENPDVYVSSPHSAPDGVTSDKIKSRPNYKGLKAIQNDRVYIINQDLISRASPRIVEGLKEFASALYPELADEINKI